MLITTLITQEIDFFSFYRFSSPTFIQAGLALRPINLTSDFHFKTTDKRMDLVPEKRKKVLFYPMHDTWDLLIPPTCNERAETHEDEFARDIITSIIVEYFVHYLPQTRKVSEKVIGLVGLLKHSYLSIGMVSLSCLDKAAAC